RQYERTFPLLARSGIDQVSVECAASRVPPALLRLLDGKAVLAGVIDVASHRVETPEEVADTIRRALEHVPATRLVPCTNCGMAPLPREVARGKLRALGLGAALVRAELGERRHRRRTLRLRGAAATTSAARQRCPSHRAA